MSQRNVNEFLKILHIGYEKLYSKVEYLFIFIIDLIYNSFTNILNNFLFGQFKTILIIIIISECRRSTVNTIVSHPCSLSYLKTLS